MADSLQDVLSQPSSASLLLLFLVLVLEHLLDLLEDLEGVGQVYELGESHVPLAPGAFLGVSRVLVLEADLADDRFAAGGYQPLRLLLADHTGVVLHSLEELVLYNGLGGPGQVSLAAF